jgi:hypothetical protein
MISLCSQCMLKCIKYIVTIAAELRFPTSPAAAFHAAFTDAGRTCARAPTHMYKHKQTKNKQT